MVELINQKKADHYREKLDSSENGAFGLFMSLLESDPKVIGDAIAMASISDNPMDNLIIAELMNNSVMFLKYMQKLKKVQPQRQQQQQSQPSTPFQRRQTPQVNRYGVSLQDYLDARDNGYNGKFKNYHPQGHSAPMGGSVPLQTQMNINKPQLRIVGVDQWGRPLYGQ